MYPEEPAAYVCPAYPGVMLPPLPIYRVIEFVFEVEIVGVVAPLAPGPKLFIIQFELATIPVGAVLAVTGKNKVNTPVLEFSAAPTVT